MRVLRKFVSFLRRQAAAAKEAGKRGDKAWRKAREDGWGS
jgi:hypothetical protein